MLTLREKLNNHFLSREHHMECGDFCEFRDIESWVYGEGGPGLVERVDLPGRGDDTGGFDDGFDMGVDAVLSALRHELG